MLGRRSLLLTWLFCIQIALILGVGSRQRQNKDLQVLLLNIFVLQRSASGCDSEDLKDKNKSFLQTIFFFLIFPSSFSIYLCRFFLFYCDSTRKKQQQSLQREKATWREKVVHILRDRNNMLSFIACGRRQQMAVETKLMVSIFKLER